jgi:hypothetical protein
MPVLVAPLKFESPLETAVMGCVPATRVDTEKVALVPTRGDVPKAVDPSMNVMVPLDPAGAVAVRVTAFW